MRTLDRLPIHRVWRTAVLAVLLACLALGCFNPDDLPPFAIPFEEDREIPITSATEFETELVGTDDGLTAVHGHQCAGSDAESETGDKQEIQRLSTAIMVPDDRTDALVIHQGASFEFLESDEHLLAARSYISDDITVGENGRVAWTAWGLVSDDNFDNPYSWCYWFTVIAWDRTKYDIQKMGRYETGIHAKDIDLDRPNPEDFNQGMPKIVDTAFSDLTAPRATPLVVIPSGYQYRYAGGDEHVIQLGISLEVSRSGGDPADQLSRVHSIIKDNDEKPGNAVATVFQTYQGDDIFSTPNGAFDYVLRDDDGSNTVPCDLQNGPSEPELIEGPILGSDFIVPVLAGWEIYHPCDDEEIRFFDAHLDRIEIGDSTRGARSWFDWELNDDSNHWGLGDAIVTYVLLGEYPTASSLE